MKHRDERFQSKYRMSRILKFMSVASVLICICAWIFSSKLGIEFSQLMIITGFALLIVDLAYMNSNKMKNIKVLEKHLDKNRDEIGMGDYNSDIFYANDTDE